MVDRIEQEKQIIESVTSSINDSGWANLTVVGKKLKRKGVKFAKLSKFLSSFANILAYKEDYDIVPPVKYVKIKGENDDLIDDYTF